MKKLKTKIITGLLVASALVNLKGQTQFTCNFTSPPPSSPPTSSTYCYGCANFANYIPQPSDSVVYLRLNIYYTMPSVNGGIFSSATLGDGIALTSYINSHYDSLFAPRLKKYFPTPQYISRSKIHFVLNSFQKVVDASYNGTTSFNGTSSNAFNVVFVTHPTINGYGYASLNSNIAYMVHSPAGGTGSYPGTYNGEAGLVSHELAHCLGLDHTNVNILSPFSTINDTCFKTDYVIEGAGFPGNINCNQADTLHSNNIISQNSWDCTHYLSPNQLVVARYNLRNNPVLNNCIINQTTFNASINTGNVCTLPTIPIDTLINFNQTWNSNNLNINGNIIVKTGNSLTINCSQYLKAGAKIIVEPGALLTINPTVVIKSTCLQQWGGIEVWGDASLPQTPANQGMLVLNTCDIDNAITGISVGKRLTNGVFVPNSGGGIVNSQFAAFNNNLTDVEFAPYVRYRKIPVGLSASGFAPISNSSYFKINNFTTDSTAGNVLLKLGAVSLNNVYGIKFEGCNFVGSNLVGFGIQGLNSSFIVKNSGSTKNNFTGFTNSIYANSNTYNSPIVIDSAIFYTTGNNSIFLINTVNPRISNNSFNIFNFSSTTPPKTGLYLSKCTGYIVENNVFYGGSNIGTVGSYIGQSGPYANSVYNNQFTNLQQGLWALGQNYDPATIGNPGLTINCNDFSGCQYDIGVYKSSKSFLGVPNNTGIAPTQGIANTLFESDNVRNTYNVVSCNINAENKYNINTQNAFAVTSHGSFLGAQFHPTPQTSNSCSNGLELFDINGLAPINPTKNSYCPISVLPSLSRVALQQQISTLTQSVATLKNQQATLIDGGNTQSLLTAINGNTSNGNLKNLLESKSPYLSDTVLKAYFAKSSTPNGHIKDIHALNAPVSQPVWTLLLGLNLPNGIQNQLNTQQNQNKLSTKNKLLANTQLYTTKLGLAYNEKLRRLTADTSAGTVDSVLAIYNTNVIANSPVFKVNIYTTLGQYADATIILNDLNSQGGLFTDYVFAQNEVLQLKQNADYKLTLIKNVTKKDRLLTIRNTANYLAEGIATSLLQQVWGIKQLDEEKPVPAILNNGGRLKNSDNLNDDSILQLSDNVLVYPNPAKETLSIQYDNIDETAELCILDITGKQVLKQALINNKQINISSLTNGVYLINLIQNNKVVSVKKIVIVK